MSTVEQDTEEAPGAGSWDLTAHEPTIAMDLALAEAEALRGWLLKASAEGATSLEDPLVSRVLARLGLEVDGARSVINVRRELAQAGLSVDHLSDDEVRQLGSRIAAAGATGARA